MLKKVIAGLFTSMILISALGMAGCSTQNSFEKQLQDYEKQKQMEGMSK